MTIPTQIPTESTSTANPNTQVRVWDRFIRAFHWTLAAAFMTAFIVEDDLLNVHVNAGYLVFILIAVRIIWGVIGSEYARFSDFVRQPREIMAYLKAALTHQAPRYLGHNPAGGAMVIVMLLTLTATALSGMALYGATEFAGPLAGMMSGASEATGEAIEEVHEFFANFTLALVFFHLAGVAFSSLSHRENLIGAMITGFKRSAK
ncbi:cytochrome b/b6 domain-containing protein [Chromatium okenii]|jgi:cytochrome b|uniref:Cytochrome B n=1 Tax=Chromatium okenii TaxID=61644 RepID=A0A2S7XUA3_9GAMM|nr:cytochrome b/b6 domain-containing protein [Chromatium okenii]PQJ97324.1 cytochrome B [Chromatium okenii]